MPFAVAVSSGMTVAVALGLVVYWLMIRRVMGEPPHVGLMLTVGLGTMLNGMMIVLFGGGMLGIPTGLPGFTQLGSVRLPTADIVAAVGAWLAIGAIALVYHLTDIGLQMRAVAEKVMLSAQRGLNVDRIVALSWAIGILAAGLAGILHGERALVALSASVIGISALIACLIGGMDSLKGVVVAGLHCRRHREPHGALYRSALYPDRAGTHPAAGADRAAVGIVRHRRRVQTRMTFRSRAIRTPSSLSTSNEHTFALRRGRAQWLIIVLWVDRPRSPCRAFSRPSGCISRSIA